MRRRTWLGGSVAAVVFLGGGAWTAIASGSEIDVELVGFLVGLPEAGIRLPPQDVVTARLEVPNQQGGARIVFPVEFTARTEVGLPAGRARQGQLVVLQGVLRQHRVRALRVQEVDVVEYTARMSLPDGPLALPVAADRVVEVVLDGASRLPVGFLVTPQTMSARTSLRDGEAVTLAVVKGLRIVVGIEGGQ